MQSNPLLRPLILKPTFLRIARRSSALRSSSKRRIPWHGMPHQIETDEAMIYVTTLTPLTDEQTHWFRTTPEIHAWESQNPSGSLTFPNQIPTTQTYPCCFTYEAEGRSACLDLCAGMTGELPAPQWGERDQAPLRERTLYLSRTGQDSQRSDGARRSGSVIAAGSPARVIRMACAQPARRRTRCSCRQAASARDAAPASAEVPGEG